MKGKSEVSSNAYIDCMWVRQVTVQVKHFKVTMIVYRDKQFKIFCGSLGKD